MLLLLVANLIILPVAISFFNDDLSTSRFVLNFHLVHFFSPQDHLQCGLRHHFSLRHRHQLPNWWGCGKKRQSGDVPQKTVAVSKVGSCKNFRLQGERRQWGRDPRAKADCGRVHLFNCLTSFGFNAFFAGGVHEDLVLPRPLEQPPRWLHIPRPWLRPPRHQPSKQYHPKTVKLLSIPNQSSRILQAFQIW